MCASACKGRTDGQVRCYLNPRIREANFGTKIDTSSMPCIASDSYFITKSPHTWYLTEDHYRPRKVPSLHASSEFTCVILECFYNPDILTTSRKRDENLARATELAAQGKHSEARDYYTKCVDVTPEMAFQLIKVPFYFVPVVYAFV
jgi:hypothetical protein